MGWMFYDPTMMILIPAIILSAWAQMKVSGTFRQYAQVYTASGLTGAEVARRILLANGITDVRIEQIAGSMTDHYDPRSQVLRLSQTVYGKTSIAAVSVAAHEVGHAIQHDTDYVPMRIRSALVPVAQFGSYGSWILLIIGLIFAITPLVEIGIYLFVAVVVFQLVTLPVEFNASARALAQLESGGYLTVDEIGSGKKVLRAAAFTYVAAVIMAIAQLIRLLIISGVLRR